MESVSVVLPCYNEAENLKILLPRIKEVCPNAEILVVNDASEDNSKEICEQYSVDVISHPYRMGNGAAIKSGARHAKGEVIIFMDADGQHDPKYIPGLIRELENGYEMVVGARELTSHASIPRKLANKIYNRFASYMIGRRILDLTSGFRAVRARHFRKFLYLLPNGFSYPTTSTMAFFRAGLPVAYIPIEARKRGGESKINPLRDGARFLLIIIKIGALFSPMRLFLPISATLFIFGLSLYSYNFITEGRFTNMSVLLFMSSLFTFLIGILSEQVSSLHYRGVEEDVRKTDRSNPS